MILKERMNSSYSILQIRPSQNKTWEVGAMLSCCHSTNNSSNVNGHAANNTNTNKAKTSGNFGIFSFRTYCTMYNVHVKYNICIFFRFVYFQEWGRGDEEG